MGDTIYMKHFALRQLIIGLVAKFCVYSYVLATVWTSLKAPYSLEKLVWLLARKEYLHYNQTADLNSTLSKSHLLQVYTWSFPSVGIKVQGFLWLY